MRNLAPHAGGRGDGDDVERTFRLPRPTLRYRLAAWRAFQRALDPLAPPKPFSPRDRRY